MALPSQMYVCSDSAPLQPHNKVPLENAVDEGRIKGMELSDWGRVESDTWESRVDSFWHFKAAM